MKKNNNFKYGCWVSEYGKIKGGWSSFLKKFLKIFVILPLRTLLGHQVQKMILLKLKKSSYRPQLKQSLDMNTLYFRVIRTPGSHNKQIF